MEYREVVIDITKLRDREIVELSKLCEKLKVECYIQDERGNTIPFLRADMEKVFGNFVE